MYYIYILKSDADQKLYIGYSGNLQRRIREHNERRSKATAYRYPFRLVYYEAYQSERDARVRERRLKKFKNGYKELTKRLQYSLSTKVVGGLEPCE